MGRHGRKMIFELIGFRKLLVCLLKFNTLAVALKAPLL